MALYYETLILISDNTNFTLAFDSDYQNLLLA